MKCKKCGSEMYPTNDEWADGFVTGFTCIYCDYEREEQAKKAQAELPENKPTEGDK